MVVFMNSQKCKFDTAGWWWCSWAARNANLILQVDGGVHEQPEMQIWYWRLMVVFMNSQKCKFDTACRWWCLWTARNANYLHWCTNKVGMWRWRFHNVGVSVCSVCVPVNPRSTGQIFLSDPNDTIPKSYPWDKEEPYCFVRSNRSTSAYFIFSSIFNEKLSWKLCDSNNSFSG